MLCSDRWGSHRKRRSGFLVWPKKRKKKDKSVLIVKETLEAWVIRGDTDWCVLYEVVGFTEPSYSNLFCPRDRTRSLRSRIGLN